MLREGVPFSHILGQDAVVETLQRALVTRRLHHAYRFEGPDGTGKEMTALALAQALVCTAGDVLGCGRCDACHRAVTFSPDRPHAPLHPDVIFVERNFYPASVIGRSRDELTDISVDQIRRIVLAHAAYGPHEARARLFIVRRADELSVSAANALLKTLEEPHDGTHFILMSARPDRLLDTIRSRTMPLRFAPLGGPILRSILTRHGVAEAKQDMAIELSGGSASSAIELGDEALAAARDRFVESVMAAVRARDLGPAVVLAESRDQDRDQLRTDLRALGAALARTARRAAGSAPEAALQAARRYAAVSRAVAHVDRNASTTLTMISLVAELRETF